MDNKIFEKETVYLENQKPFIQLFYYFTAYVQENLLIHDSKFNPKIKFNNKKINIIYNEESNYLKLQKKIENFPEEMKRPLYNYLDYLYSKSTSLKNHNTLKSLTPVSINNNF